MDRYLQVKGLPSAERLREAESASPAELAQEFNEAVTAFEAFPGSGFTFYDEDQLARDRDKSEKADLRTYGWGMAMKGLGRIPFGEDPGLDFVYVDREIVPTRMIPRPTGAQLEVDLILANADTGRPIVGELKIGNDKDPYTALVQVLAGAAQLLSDPQRERLTAHSEHLRSQRQNFSPRLASKAEEPLVDVYVLLADFPERGNHLFDQLDLARSISAELEREGLCDGLGRIRILSISRVAVSTRLPERAG